MFWNTKNNLDFHFLISFDKHPSIWKLSREEPLQRRVDKINSRKQIRGNFCLIIRHCGWRLLRKSLGGADSRQTSMEIANYQRDWDSDRLFTRSKLDKKHARFEEGW